MFYSAATHLHSQCSFRHRWDQQLGPVSGLYRRPAMSRQRDLRAMSDRKWYASLIPSLPRHRNNGHQCQTGSQQRVNFPAVMRALESRYLQGLVTMWDNALSRLPTLASGLSRLQISSRILVRNLQPTSWTSFLRALTNNCRRDMKQLAQEKYLS